MRRRWSDAIGIVEPNGRQRSLLLFQPLGIAESCSELRCAFIVAPGGVDIGDALCLRCGAPGLPPCEPRKDGSGQGDYERGNFHGNDANGGV